jgi:hypothetical protein
MNPIFAVLVNFIAGLAVLIMLAGLVAVFVVTVGLMTALIRGDIVIPGLLCIEVALGLGAVYYLGRTARGIYRGDL